MGAAMRYLRKESTGQVFDWNPHMAAEPGMQEFETEGSVPDVIPDLIAFLIQQRPAPKPVRGVKLQGA